MSAYVIVEFTVKDPDVVGEKYSPNAAQTVKEQRRRGSRRQRRLGNLVRAIPCSGQGCSSGFPTMRRLSDGTTRLNISS